VSFVTITLCVASQRVSIIIVAYFVIYSVRKLLDTPLYVSFMPVALWYGMVPRKYSVQLSELHLYFNSL